MHLKFLTCNIHHSVGGGGGGGGTYLHVLLVDVMSQVGELSVAVGAGLGLARALLLHLVHHHRVVVVVVVHQS